MINPLKREREGAIILQGRGCHWFLMLEPKSIRNGWVETSCTLNFQMSITG